MANHCKSQHTRSVGEVRIRATCSRDAGHPPDYHEDETVGVKWGAAVGEPAIKGYVVRWAVGARLCFNTFRAANRVHGEAEKAGEQVSILRVFADGREEELPSYETALGELEQLRAEIAAAHAMLDERSAGTIVVGLNSANDIVDRPATLAERIEDVVDECADPLDALEAAERRVLESEGWRPEHGEPMWWIKGKLRASRGDALSIARLSARERRRAAEVAASSKDIDLGITGIVEVDADGNQTIGPMKARLL